MCLCVCVCTLRSFLSIFGKRTATTSKAMADDTTNSTTNSTEAGSSVVIRPYQDENDLPKIQELMAAHLSEPYSVYTYRYFLIQWGKISHVVCRCHCVLAFCLSLKLSPFALPLSSLPSLPSSLFPPSPLPSFFLQSTFALLAPGNHKR